MATWAITTACRVNIGRNKRLWWGRGSKPARQITNNGRIVMRPYRQHVNHQGGFDD
jgi:hypothetical protein